MKPRVALHLQSRREGLHACPTRPDSREEISHLRRRWVEYDPISTRNGAMTGGKIVGGSSWEPSLRDVIPLGARKANLRARASVSPCELTREGLAPRINVGFGSFPLAHMLKQVISLPHRGTGFGTKAESGARPPVSISRSTNHRRQIPGTMVPLVL